MIYAIGDLHLSLGVNKPMDIFKGWENYTDRLAENWRRTVNDEDTVVICGDVSWAMNNDELMPDLEYLCALPGRKVILKGNHDYWWSTVSAMRELLVTNGFTGITFLHNNCVVAEGRALCGTRGWLLENKKSGEDDQKIVARECGRLKMSLEEGRKSGLPITAFLHYPPVFDNYECDGIISLLNEYGVSRCYYGHIHSSGARLALCGEYRDIDFRLVSADCIGFLPFNI